MDHPYLDTIRRRFPDLTIFEARLITMGQNNDILLVNGELIFRFPKYPDGISQLRREWDLLKVISSHIKLQIPQPIFFGLDTEKVGHAFMGYRKINGIPFSKQIYIKYRNNTSIRRNANHLGQFLKALHNIPQKELDHLQLSLYNPEDMVSLYHQVKDLLVPQLSPAAQKQIIHHFESYLSNPFSFTPALIHGDFGPSNILIDPDSKIVQGIIDFGGSGYGDPAYDFAGLLNQYGLSFVQCCLKAYGEQTSRILRRANFYAGTFAVTKPYLD